MRRTMILLVMLGFVCGPMLLERGSAFAQEEVAKKKGKKARGAKKGKKQDKVAEGEKAEKKAKPALEDMTVSGTVTKEEKENKKGEAMALYSLTDAEGNVIRLPGGAGPGRGKKKDAPAVNLEEYVNSAVTITGKGMSVERKGKTTTRIVRITNVEKATE